MMSVALRDIGFRDLMVHRVPFLSPLCLKQVRPQVGLMAASCQEVRSPRCHLHAHLSLGLSGATGNERLWSLGFYKLI